MTKLVVNCVELVTVTGPAVTPEPLTATVVAPVTKFVPVSVIEATVVPATPVFGEICVNVGEDGIAAVIEKVTALVVPPAVVTVTFRFPVVAAASIMKLVVSCVPLVTVTVPTVTPVPLTATVAPVTKLVPVNVTEASIVPAAPVFGEICVNVGAAGIPAVMVNVTALLDPPAVVTVTLRFPVAAAGSTMKLVVSCVALVTVTGPTVTPEPLTATVVAPVTKFVPVSVIGLTVVPAAPVFGET
jgi:hypothetical protein